MGTQKSVATHFRNVLFDYKQRFIRLGLPASDAIQSPMDLRKSRCWAKPDGQVSDGECEKLPLVLRALSR